MSWSIAAALSTGAAISPELRSELKQAVASPPSFQPTCNNYHLETTFCHISLAWSDWRNKPLAEVTSGPNNARLSLILLGECFEAASINPRELLARYQQQGITALEGLNGRYIALVVDEVRQRLQVVTDALGLRKLYQCELSGQLLLCSSLESFRAISAFRPRLDHYGAAQLLITSHLCDEHSLLEGVTLLPPATRLQCQGATVQHERYWTPSIESADAERDDSIERMMAEASQALNCRLQGTERLMLPLSGGLDSRLLAGLLPPSLHSRTHSCSYGHSHSYDRRIGQKVARALGLAHQSLSLPTQLYSDYQQCALGLADGEISIEAFPLFRLLEAGTPGETLLSGYAGDWISAKKLLHEQGSMEASMAHLWQKLYVRMGFQEGLFAQVVCHPELKRGYQRLQQTMQSAFDQARADSFAEKAQLLEFWHRQRRYVTYQLSALEARFRVVAPLCDSELVKRWLCLPMSLKEGQRGYRQLIHKVSPALAALPVAGSRRYQSLGLENTEERLDALARLQQSLASSGLNEGLKWRLNTGLKGAGRLLVKASGGWLGPHNRGLLVHHDQDIRQQNPQWFKQQLFDPAMTEGVYDVRALQQLWDEHCRGLQDHSVRINNLIMLSAFRRHWSL
ncbi:asparagine synthase-related protein [Aestuariirhabdus sp. Z084]|uniref:asparagine synthase-related protein n=1 Tax=Aestuariirhabdus haliotis TaxID=2918751 RepID=UPI00201B3BAF|nr:asparagine synthetase B family protein [Aestuariirhabdus haliotis]MCL6415745.1 asparagine synthase-related protein [Aestuariirhabdus haliotis]MCL6419662.1 asparagine synthase-related protein [Aestuariirhabdus haliotis]